MRKHGKWKWKSSKIILRIFVIPFEAERERYGRTTKVNYVAHDERIESPRGRPNISHHVTFGPHKPGHHVHSPAPSVRARDPSARRWHRTLAVHARAGVQG